MATHDPEIFYDISDYQEAFWDDCRIIIATQRTIAIALSALGSAEYFNTRWYDDGIPISSPEQRSVAVRYFNNALAELTMTCDIEETLDRIATALEQIRDVVVEGIPVAPQNGNLKPYVDELEEVIQEVARGIAGITVPITEEP